MPERGRAGRHRPLHLRCPIATGERLFTKWGFREVLEKRAATILQPDLSPRRRHHGDPPDRRHGRGLLRRHRPALPARPDRARRLRPARRVHPQLPLPGGRAPQTPASGYLKVPFRHEDGYLPLPTGPGPGHRAGRGAMADKRSATTGRTRRATPRTARRSTGSSRRVRRWRPLRVRGRVRCGRAAALSARGRPAGAGGPGGRVRHRQRPRGRGRGRALRLRPGTRVPTGGRRTAGGVARARGPREGGRSAGGAFRQRAVVRPSPPANARYRGPLAAARSGPPPRSTVPYRWCLSPARSREESDPPGRW